MELLTKEDIESAGFIYEPDASKCKIRKIRCHFDCNYYNEGKWEHRTTPELTDEWKTHCKEKLKEDMTSYNWPYIHSVFVPEVEPTSGQGVMCRWVMIKGHGYNTLSEKWETTGLLEGLEKERWGDMAEVLEKIAQVIVKNAPEKENKDEYEKWDQFCDFIMPALVKIYKLIYPKKFPEEQQFVDDSMKWWNEHQDLRKDLSSYIVPGDGELRDFYAEEVAKKL